MNILETGAVAPADGAFPRQPAGGEKAADAQMLQFAKDFESVFVEKLLDTMKNSIGDWGLEQTAGSKQIQGLFWMHLARDVSEKGGLGLWKDIYQSLQQADNPSTNAKKLDSTL